LIHHLVLNQPFAQLNNLDIGVAKPPKLALGQSGRSAIFLNFPTHEFLTSVTCALFIMNATGELPAADKKIRLFAPAATLPLRGFLLCPMLASDG
jgi:hypothetical protein